MKKLLLPALMVLGMFGSASYALADSYYWHVSWNDGSDVPQTQDLFLDGNYQYFVASNVTTRAPELWTTDTSFVWNNTTKQLEVGNISQDNVDLLVPDLAAKASASDLSTLSSTVSSMSSSLSTMLSSYNSLSSQINANLYGTSTTMTLANASTTNGLMSRADKSKLDGIASWSWSSPSHSVVTGTGATGFQVSATRNATARYNVKVTTTASIAGNADGYLTLEMAPTNSATAGDWVEVGRCGNSQALTLAVTLQSVQGTTCELTTDIPAGYYAKLRSVTTTGTVSFAYVSGQEVLK